MADIRQDPSFAPFVAQLEQERGLPAGLLQAQITAESKGRNDAVSPVGAQGVSQFMPATAKQYNVDVSNPWDSMRGQADYMYDLLKKYNGNVEAAISAYNGGHYNALHYSEGAERNPQRVSQKNWDENKRYTGEIMGYLNGGAQPGVNAAPKQGQGPDVGQVEQTVTQMVNAGEGNYTILRKLRDMGLGPTIDMATEKGYKPEDIVNRIGGKTLEPYLRERANVDAAGAVPIALEGARNKISDLALGAQQIGAAVTGNDAQGQALQAEAAQRQQDPRRVAVGDSTAGAVGGGSVIAVPSIAAGLLTGGASIPLQAGIQGGVGAAMGAFEPTTADGQRASNIGYGAAGGAAGGALGGSIAAAPRILTRGTQAALRGGEDVATVAARQAALQAEGIDAGAATLGKGAASVANTLDNNVIGATAGAADKRLLTETQMAQAINKRIGSTADEISSDAVIEGERNTGNLYNSILKNKDVTLSPESKKIATNYLDDQIKAADSLTRDELLAKFGPTLQALKSGGNTVPAEIVQAIRSDIGGNMANQTLSAATRGAYKAGFQRLDNEIMNSLSQAEQEGYRQANAQWRNLQAVKTMVAKSNDSGTVSPRQMLAAIKQGKFKNDFVHGDAPFQDLVQALQAGETRGLNSPFGKAGAAFGAGALGGPGGVVASALGGNLAMRLLTDPRYANALLGLTPVQRNAIMQAANGIGIGAGSAAGSEIALEKNKRSTPTAADYSKALAEKYRTR